MCKAAALVLLATSACKPTSKQPSPPPPAPGAAHDPWAASAGSSLDIPAWASDPPAVLRDKINGVNAHVVVLKSQATFSEYRDVLAVAERTPQVTAAEPFIFVEGDIAKGSGAPASTALKAVDPARVDRVLTIGKHMVTGTLASLAAGEPPSIVLGDGLARRLGVHSGDDVAFTIPPLDDVPARTKTFRVTGTFHMAFDEYDDRLAIAALAPVQAIVGRGDQVMGIEMTVNDFEHADAVARAIETALGGPPYQAMDWYELNKQTFTALFGDKHP